MYKRRYLEPYILKLSKAFPVVILTGPRQVGKTTILRHLSENAAGFRRRYVSLDEFAARSLAKSDPGIFLQQYPPPLIIDEIQYAPQLLTYIKAAVEQRRRMGAYWLTGSQQFHLMRNVSESLAGRAGIVKMMGMSLSEERGERPGPDPFSPAIIKIGERHSGLSILQIFKKIIRGSFPRLLHRDAPSLDSFYGSYVQTYIDRDLRDLVKVSSLSSFEKFIRICAARTATMLNLSDLARDSNISVNTAKEWLGLLETSGQIFLLRPYYLNITKRLIKAPKLYFLDTGLVCYLTGWRDAQVTLRGAFSGQLFETFVVAEVIKSYWHRGKEPRIFYFRTKEKAEIDILFEENGKLMPAEIKLSSMIGSDDLKVIKSLKKTKFSVGKGAVISPVPHSYPLANDLSVVPPSAIV
jgi:predicted AAA+ superfamily ATPase